MMKKCIRLLELHDIDCLPASLRDMFTDFISYFESLKQIYAPVAGLIEPVAAMSESFKIIDLCSGGGSPAVTVMNASKPEIASRMEITLTDKYPNLAAFKSISDKSDGKIKYIAEPVDALTPPEYLKGFRTIFSAFHHFDKASAAAILADTVEKRQGIGIFEYTDRSMVKFLIPFGIAVQLWLLFKFSFLKPFDWRRLLWTFLIPVLPAMVFWDGFVSCMRTYSVKELEELIMPFSDCGYSWKTGRMESSLPFYITYLIGYPED